MIKDFVELPDEHALLGSGTAVDRDIHVAATLNCLVYVLYVKIWK